MNKCADVLVKCKDCGFTASECEFNDLNDLLICPDCGGCDIQDSE